MDEWTCARCGDSFWGDPPDDQLCGACQQDLEHQESGP